MLIDESSLQAGSILAFPLVFLGGVATSLGPCNLATIPLIVGYIGGAKELTRGRSFAISFTFAVGLAVTFMFLGIDAALLGGLFGTGSKWWYYLVAAVCLNFITSYKQLHDGNSPTWNMKNKTGDVFVRNHRRLQYP